MSTTLHLCIEEHKCGVRSTNYITCKSIALGSSVLLENLLRVFQNFLLLVLDIFVKWFSNLWLYSANAVFKVFNTVYCRVLVVYDLLLFSGLMKFFPPFIALFCIPGFQIRVQWATSSFTFHSTISRRNKILFTH